LLHDGEVDQNVEEEQLGDELVDPLEEGHLQEVRFTDLHRQQQQQQDD